MHMQSCRFQIAAAARQSIVASRKLLIMGTAAAYMQVIQGDNTRPGVKLWSCAHLFWLHCVRTYIAYLQSYPFIRLFSF
jgi:hypothetical protein